MIKRILCCCDRSDSSLEAVRTSAELAQSLGATVVLLHVTAPPRTLAPFVVAWQIDRGGTSTLDAPAIAPAPLLREEGILGEAGVPYEVRFEPGYPHETIIDIARDENVDLIVMGSRGSSGDLTMGTVVDHVARNARHPVLVVR